MTVIDTSIVIERIKENVEIGENITEVTLIEYSPIINYTKFYGKVFTIERKDILLSMELQRRLRNVGKAKPFVDLLIASICINRKEELITKDKDFLDIAEISELKVKFA